MRTVQLRNYKSRTLCPTRECEEMKSLVFWLAMAGVCAGGEYLQYINYDDGLDSVGVRGVGSPNQIAPTVIDGIGGQTNVMRSALTYPDWRCEVRLIRANGWWSMNYGVEYSFGWKFYLDADSGIGDDSRSPTVIFQLHSQSNRQPPFDIALSRDDDDVLTKFVSKADSRQDRGNINIFTRKKTYSHTFTNLRGRWSDWRVDYLPSWSDDGLLRVTVDGVVIIEQDGPNVYNETAGGPWPAWGIYQPSFKSRRPVTNDRECFHDDVWFCEAADPPQPPPDIPQEVIDAVVQLQTDTSAAKQESAALLLEATTLDIQASQLIDAARALQSRANELRQKAVSVDVRVENLGGAVDRLLQLIGKN